MSPEPHLPAQPAAVAQVRDESAVQWEQAHQRWSTTRPVCGYLGETVKPKSGDWNHRSKWAAAGVTARPILQPALIKNVSCLVSFHYNKVWRKVIKAPSCPELLRAVKTPLTVTVKRVWGRKTLSDSNVRNVAFQHRRRLPACDLNMKPPPSCFIYFFIFLLRKNNWME